MTLGFPSSKSKSTSSSQL